VPKSREGLLGAREAKIDMVEEILVLINEFPE
jgi:hypothetical protein